MSQIPELIKIKLDQAEEIPRILMDLCLLELINPSATHLTTISVRLGGMSHILRSALNNMMWNFSEEHLRSILSNNEYEKIRWSHDFPIERDRSSFENSKFRILRHIKTNFPDLYHFLEKSQPYHSENHILHTIKILNNDTSHTTPIEVLNPKISDVLLDNGEHPKIMGDYVVLPLTKDKPPHTLRTPCFIEALDMFASKDRGWVIYMIGIDQNPKYSVTGFIGLALPTVERLISDFYEILN